MYKVNTPTTLFLTCHHTNHNSYNLTYCCFSVSWAVLERKATFACVWDARLTDVYDKKMKTITKNADTAVIWEYGDLAGGWNSVTTTEDRFVSSSK